MITSAARRARPTRVRRLPVAGRRRHDLRDRLPAVFRRSGPGAIAEPRPRAQFTIASRRPMPPGHRTGSLTSRCEGELTVAGHTANDALYDATTSPRSVRRSPLVGVIDADVVSLDTAAAVGRSRKAVARAKPWRFPVCPSPGGGAHMRSRRRRRRQASRRSTSPSRDRRSTKFYDGRRPRRSTQPRGARRVMRAIRSRSRQAAKGRCRRGRR